MPKEKKSTSPWKNKFWTRDRFTVQKRKGYRVRFVSQSNVDDKKHQGWVVADGKNYGEDAGQVMRRGMVMMETSEQNALDREAYYANLTDSRSKTAADEIKAKAAEGSTEAEDVSTSVIKTEA